MTLMYIKTIFGEIEIIFGLETYCIFQLYFKNSYPEMHKVQGAKCAIGYQAYVWSVLTDDNYSLKLVAYRSVHTDERTKS